MQWCDVKVCDDILVVLGRLGSRNSGRRSIVIYWSGKISEDDSYLRWPAHHCLASPNHVLRLCHYRRLGVRVIHLNRR